MTKRERSLIHRLAFIRTEEGSCPATTECPHSCVDMPYTNWDKRFFCWCQHYNNLADTPFHTQIDTAHSMSCSDCTNHNTIACNCCGWEKEMYNGE